jgi:hypothetical protein
LFHGILDAQGGMWQIGFWVNRLTADIINYLFAFILHHLAALVSCKLQLSLFENNISNFKRVCCTEGFFERVFGDSGAFVGVAEYGFCYKNFSYAADFAVTVV